LNRSAICGFATGLEAEDCLVEGVRNGLEVAKETVRDSEHSKGSVNQTHQANKADSDDSACETDCSDRA
jgi:hypothetical protein